MNEENIDDDNFALKTRKRDNLRDKSKKHAREHKERWVESALERLCENTFKSKSRQDTMIY